MWERTEDIRGVIKNNEALAVERRKQQPSALTRTGSLLQQPERAGAERNEIASNSAANVWAVRVVQLLHFIVQRDRSHFRLARDAATKHHDHAEFPERVGECKIAATISPRRESGTVIRQNARHGVRPC